MGPFATLRYGRRSLEPTISFPENWTAPPELKRALPREVRRSTRGTLLACLAVIYMAGSLPLYVSFRNDARQQSAHTEALRTQGREASAEIVRFWHQGKSSTRMVAYAFTADGRRVRGESSVPDRFWEGLQKAGFLPIRYLPANPNINHPLAWEDYPMSAWVPYLLPVILAGGGVALLFSLRRQAQLAAEGLATPGIVTNCRRLKGGWKVGYQFRTKEGDLAKGSSRVGRALESGASLCVLYLPQDIRRNQAYPLSFYRVEV